MVLRAAFANPGLAFLVGAVDASDFVGVAEYADAGNDVFDHDYRSYVALPGWTYTASRLQEMSKPYDPGMYERKVGDGTQLPLPFGRPVLIASKGPLQLTCNEPPDAYVAWGSPTGKGLHTHLPIESVKKGATFTTQTGIRGLMVSQTIRPDGSVRSTFHIVRADLRHGRDLPALISMYSGHMFASHQRQQRPRLPRLSPEWERIMHSALEGFYRECKPYMLPDEEAEVAKEHHQLMIDLLSSCESAHEALELVSSTEELRLAASIWGPRSTLQCSPYKRVRRLVEAYLEECDPSRREQVAVWWEELKHELRPVN